MDCPRCGHKEFVANAPCPACDFRGAEPALEKYFQLKFLLNEIDAWNELSHAARQQLRQRYARPLRQVEIELGLRPPPLDAGEARQAYLELSQRFALLNVLDVWKRKGVLHDQVVDELATRTRQQIAELQDRMRDCAVFSPPDQYTLALERARYLEHTLQELRGSDVVKNPTARVKVLAVLADQVRKNEKALGLPPSRPPAAPPAEAVLPSPVSAATPPVPPPVVAAPARPVASPRKPFTWDRLLETLLSERTLRVLLFLGAFLLVMAAGSLVVWNWQAFPPWLQVFFLALFTGVFYALGWYVRTHMKLRQSGIALSAVASLFVPFDFYAFYLSGGFPAESWPQVWLLASLVCLGIYLITAYLIQAEFFGYAVALAAGSALAAALRVASASQVYWPPLLAGLGLALGITAEALLRFSPARWRLLARPFWHTALLNAAVILILHTSDWALGERDDLPIRLALALDWWLGGLAFALAAGRFHTRWVGLAAAGSLPVAVLFSENLLFDLWSINAAWYALGLALLAPLYLWLGRRFQDAPTGSAARLHARSMVWAGALLALVSAAWALADTQATAVVHLFLGMVLVLAGRAWRRPGLLYIAGLLFAWGLAALVSTRQASLAQLGLAWALLSILYVIAAIRLRPRTLSVSSLYPLPEDGQSAQRSPSPLYDLPLFVVAWLVALFALLPPLVSSDRTVFSYVLGNWAALNGWLAWLLHARRSPGLNWLVDAHIRQATPRPARLTGWPARLVLPETLFYWVQSLSLLAWLWAVWIERRPSDARLALAYAGLGCVLLLAGSRLRLARSVYALPWYVAAHLGVLVALMLGLAHYDKPWFAVTLLLVAAFYFAFSYFSRERLWLLPGGALLPLGWILLLSHLRLEMRAQLPALALVPLGYTLAALLLERRRHVPPAFLLPLHLLAQGLSLVTLLAGIVLLVGGLEGPTLDLWVAASGLLLAASFGLHAWFWKQQYSAHSTAWLGVYAAGLVATHFSRGSGRSAALASLLAIAYILAERGLFYLGRYRPVRSASSFIPPRWAGPVRCAWQLFRKPLLFAGWSVSGGAILLALARNLLLLGGGQARERWSIASLLLVCALYAGSSYLYRRHPRASCRLDWLAAGLFVAPWSLGALQLWRAGWFTVPGYAVCWALLALLELAVGARLVLRLPAAYRRWSLPPMAVAHLLMPFSLAWGVANAAASSLTFGLALLFYLFAVWIDLRQGRATPRFLYPAVYSVPLWALYLLAHFIPAASQIVFGVVVLGFSPFALALGRWLERRPALPGGRGFALPLYFVTYTALLAGSALVAHDRPALALALLFDTLVLGLSAWLFREPLWLYPASATLPAALLLALAEWRVTGTFQGWALIACGAAYLAGAYWLRRAWVVIEAYTIPFMAAGFALVALGLPVSSRERIGAIVAYAAAALIYAACAAWLRQPLLVTAAVGLSFVPYWLGLLELQVPAQDRGLTLWPFILLTLGLAFWLDRRLGVQGEPLDAFPWPQPLRWPWAVADRLARWWAIPPYAAAFLGAAAGALLSAPDAPRLTLALALATAIYSLAVVSFRQRGWLLVAVTAAHLTVLAALRWWAWSVGRPLGVWLALAFAPVIWITVIAGLAVQRRLHEGSLFGEWQPLSGADWQGRLRLSLQLPGGWSRPLYLLAVVEIFASQLAGLSLQAESAWISLSNTLLAVLLATAWQLSWLAYLAPVMGILALLQGLSWSQAANTAWPWSLALLSLGYGLAGYLLRFLRSNLDALSRSARFLRLWEIPLCLGGWALSAASLMLALLVGVNVPLLAVRAVFSLPLITPQDQAAVQMMVAVLAVLGLFYLAAAITDRWRVLAYLALAMLLGAWSLELLLVWGSRQVQWYAIPAGVYLLGVGYIEWHYGARSLARWVDRAAVLVLLGSSYWQSLGPDGNPYALWMGAESLLLAWWGSARRLRRFLYVGVVGVTLNVATQLIEPLLSVNRWIVFGVAGAILVALAIIVERRLDDLKVLSGDLRQRLERWE